MFTNSVKVINMENLKTWRKQKNLTAEEVAQTLNVSTSYYYDLETGRRRWNEDLLNILFEKYGITANFVLNHSEEDLSQYNIVIEHAKNAKLSPEKLQKLIKHYLALLKEDLI